jgi:hypothetical protein
MDSLFPFVLFRSPALSQHLISYLSTMELLRWIHDSPLGVGASGVSPGWTAIV